MSFASATASRLESVARTVAAVAPGAMLCVTIGLAAAFVSERYGGPVMLYALLIGMAFNHLSEEGACPLGIELVAKTVLRIGVALLGARITLEQIASLGVRPLAVVLGALATTILLGAVLARALGLRIDFGVLTGGAVAICGASAALALAAVLPRHEESERQTLVTVVGVTALSTLAMVIYPMIATLLQFDDQRTAVFFGGTIHDVAQVVGAGYMVSPQVGDVSTVVKLTRVAMLVPVAVIVALCFRRGRVLGRDGEAPARAGRVPAFLLGFVALVLINSTGVIPHGSAAALASVSRGCLIAAIAALGVKTSFKKLAAVGWRPIALMVAETICLAAVVLVGVTTL